jgi:GMP reductase
LCPKNKKSRCDERAAADSPLLLCAVKIWLPWRSAPSGRVRGKDGRFDAALLRLAARGKISTRHTTTPPDQTCRFKTRRRAHADDPMRRHGVLDSRIKAACPSGVIALCIVAVAVAVGKTYFSSSSLLNRHLTNSHLQYNTMSIVEDTKIDFADVLIRPKFSTLDSRAQVSLQRSIKFRNSGMEYTGVPIIASNMDTVGTFQMAAALHKHSLFTTIHKHYSVDEWLQFAKEYPEVLKNVAISQGIGEQDQKKVESVLKQVPDVGFICIDVANGYTQCFVETIRTTRSKYPNKTIMAGNVVTGEMVEKLLLAGADIIKIGIGPGSVCTTRKKSGVGYAQFSAVMECAGPAHALGGHIISDGGCTVPGDLCKAFGAGADFVMLGGMLAGHDQCQGEKKVDPNGKEYRIFYGMSSKFAQEKHNAGLATYRASEGKVVVVPYRGNVEDTILDILGGLRSACTYTGSAKLEDLPKNAVFTKVMRQTNEVFAAYEIEK